MDAADDLERYQSLRDRVASSERGLTHHKSQADHVNAQYSLIKVDLDLSLAMQRDLRCKLRTARQLGTTLQDTLAYKEARYTGTRRRLLAALIVLWRLSRVVSVKVNRLNRLSFNNAALQDELAVLSAHHDTLKDAHIELQNSHRQSKTDLDALWLRFRKETFDHQGLKVNHAQAVASCDLFEKDRKSYQLQTREMALRYDKLQSIYGQLLVSHERLSVHSGEVQQELKILLADMQDNQRASGLALALLSAEAAEAKKAKQTLSNIKGFLLQAHRMINDLTNEGSMEHKSFGDLSLPALTISNRRLSINTMPTPPASTDTSPVRPTMSLPSMVSYLSPAPAGQQASLHSSSDPFVPSSFENGVTAVIAQLEEETQNTQTCDMASIQRVERSVSNARSSSITLHRYSVSPRPCNNTNVLVSSTANTADRYMPQSSVPTLTKRPPLHLLIAPSFLPRPFIFVPGSGLYQQLVSQSSTSPNPFSVRRSTPRTTSLTPIGAEHPLLDVGAARQRSRSSTPTSSSASVPAPVFSCVSTPFLAPPEDDSVQYKARSLNASAFNGSIANDASPALYRHPNAWHGAIGLPRSRYPSSPW